MSQVLKNLESNGYTLPALSPNPQAKFKPFLISGNQVFVSGQLPLGFGEVKEHVGQLGANISIEEGQKIAHICGLNVLAQVQAAVGDLDKVKKCVKLTIFVNSTASFIEQPVVANAVSDLMLKAFGSKGEHARSAIGVAQLPLGVAVEVEAIFEI